MSAATDYFESAVLALLLQNVNIANLGDATGVRGSSSAGFVWVGLFTAAPSDTGGGTECNYGGYTRASVARSAGAWAITGPTPTQIANSSTVSWPACTSGTNTVTHFAIFDAGTAGNMLLWGALDASRTITSGDVPTAAAGELRVQLA